MRFPLETRMRSPLEITMRIPKALYLLAVLATVGALFAHRPAVAQEGVTHYVRFEQDGRIAYGILEGDSIHELEGDLLDSPRPTNRVHKASALRLLVPLDPARISKVVGTAVNTRRPGLELPAQAHPRWFAKFPTSLTGPDGEVERPPEATNLNYEGELVVVIGKRGRHIPRERALEHLFGVAVGNDFSENTWYGEDRGREEPSRLIAKGTDSWAAIGPAIVTGLDFSDLRVVTRLNGEVVQEGSTSDLIQDVPELISNLSRYVTLLPGDVIYTGTVRFLPGKRRALEPGDVTEVEIEGLGTLRNRIVAMRP